MKALLAILAIALALALVDAAPKAHHLTASYTFEQYMKDFKKKYSGPAETARRQKIFEATLKEVLEHNSKPSLYKKGVNYLTDRDEVELARLRGGRYEPKYNMKYGRPYVPRKTVPPAATLDYRKNFPPVVTAVKDQGQCGDCWAHSVTEEIESAYALMTGQLFVLSQQQVTACTPQVGQCYSCGGSYPSLGYDYAVENGLTEEWIYPFEAYGGSNVACNANPYQSTPINTIVNISGYEVIGSNSQPDFISALNNLGPVGILVDASGWSSYESGIYDGCNYKYNISMDHAVQVVGYGTENTTDYWIVRNSWAPSWGEDGYIRMLKTAVPKCGWNNGAAYVSDCYGSVVSAWACGMCGILFGPMFPDAVPASSSSHGSSSSYPSSSGSSSSYPSSSGSSYPSSSGSSYPSSSASGKK